MAKDEMELLSGYVVGVNLTGIDRGSAVAEQGNIKILRKKI
jgi:hypothetical protein